MENKKEQPTRTPAELGYIDALDNIDIKLRKARQIIAEFYDDIVVGEAAYPDMSMLKSCGFPYPENDAEPGYQTLFKLVCEYARYATLLEAAADYLGEAHLDTVEALRTLAGRPDAGVHVVG